VSELAHIPAPPEAKSLGDWNFFEGSCGHRYWTRMFKVHRWAVETTSSDPIGVELAGCQRSDGSSRMWIWIDCDTHGLNADEVLMLAATLSRAAGELERIEGSRP
jgi:hypothetical protein